MTVYLHCMHIVALLLYASHVESCSGIVLVLCLGGHTTLCHVFGPAMLTRSMRSTLWLPKLKLRIRMMITVAGDILFKTNMATDMYL